MTENGLKMGKNTYKLGLQCSLDHQHKVLDSKFSNSKAINMSKTVKNVNNMSLT